jgi:hypothetical protein
LRDGIGASYQLPRDEEKRFIADSVETIQRVTGQTPIGWNAYWMRSSIYILDTLVSNPGAFIAHRACHSRQGCREEPRASSARGGLIGVLIEPPPERP